MSQASNPDPSPPRKPRREPTNVGSVFGKGQTEISYKSPETKDERASRLKREEDDKAHERRQEEAKEELARRKDWLAFRVFMTLIGMIAASSLLVLIFPWSSDDSKKWATLSLTTILSLCAGYLVGKTQK